MNEDHCEEGLDTSCCVQILVRFWRIQIMTVLLMRFTSCAGDGFGRL